ncbi:recombinase family protein [Microvirga makkahensis]|uniref:Recombinase family protein n=1 Tax=Microvirga makkahensis TaxID=1128670 RepID=A0A7X3SN24_9HYPH|nr:recombinase family protein [Microvirga makkahensis]MXQ10952.1 recombinase family protein [Microvirga makkahensis]
MKHVNPPVQTRPKAYSYIRMSSARQIKGDSLRRQLAASEEYAEKRGLSLDTTLREMGVSAFDGSNLNGALGKFLTMVEEGQIASGSYLLVESLDRLSRDHVLDALEIFSRIIRAGIVLVTLADGYEYSRDSIKKDWTQLIISLAIMSRAHEESALKANRLRERWNTKRGQIAEVKLTARAPFWLKLNEKRTGFDLIEDRVKVVERIFDEFIGGIGKGKIASRLNEDGIPPFSDWGDGWHGGTVVKVIQSRAVTGWFQPKRMETVEENGVRKKKRVPMGDPITDYFPRIIDEDTWLKAQAASETRLTKARGQGWTPNAAGPRGKYYSNLFSGFSQCGKCGKTMVYKPEGQRQDAMLRCSRLRRSQCDNNFKFRYVKLEREIVGWFADHGVRVDDTPPPEIKELERQIAVKQLEIGDLTLKIEQWMDLYDLSPTARDRIVKAEAQKVLLAGEIAELEKRLRAIRVLAWGPEQTAQFKDLIDQLDEVPKDERFAFRAKVAQVLREFIERIRFHPSGVVEIRMRATGRSQYLKDGVMWGFWPSRWGPEPEEIQE